MLVKCGGNLDSAIATFADADIYDVSSLDSADLNSVTFLFVYKWPSVLGVVSDENLGEQKLPCGPSKVCQATSCLHRTV